MKKLFLLLLALPLLLASCDDDNKLPSISMNVEYSGAVKSDGVLYVVQGDTLSIDSISVTSPDTKDITLGVTRYYWDHAFAGENPFVPFGMKFDTAYAPVGNHLLQIESPVYAVGYSVAQTVLTYKVTVVESEADMPTVPDAPAPETPTVKEK